MIGFTSSIVRVLAAGAVTGGALLPACGLAQLVAPQHAPGRASALLWPSLGSVNWNLSAAPTTGQGRRALAEEAAGGVVAYGLGVHLRQSGVTGTAHLPQTLFALGAPVTTQHLEPAAYFNYTLAPQRLGFQSSLRMGASVRTPSMALDFKLTSGSGVGTHGALDEGWSYTTGASLGRLFNDARLGPDGLKSGRVGLVYFSANYQF
ncbi:MAG: hypothetical protein RLZZ401_295 [Pseudomonadota bacterium]|jgi:hypothetical protein